MEGPSGTQGGINREAEGTAQSCPGRVCACVGGCVHSPGQGCWRDTQSFWTLVPSIQPALNGESLCHREAHPKAGQRGGRRPWYVSIYHPLRPPLLFRFIPHVSMTCPPGETSKAATARPHSCTFMRFFLPRSLPRPKSKECFSPFKSQICLKKGSGAF